jgi:NADPH2:quinone reductase
MQAIAIARPGGPDVLELRDMASPTPADGEVLIRVAAAGVNAPDLSQRRGDYPPPPDHSPLPGLEVSGEIVQAAGNWKVGDHVVALTNGGGYAEYVAVPAGQVLPLPKGWSLIDAAALPETWFTVTQTLVMRAGLAPGMSVLIHGAAGGIGGAAIQICRILGADPIAVVSSAEKAAYAMSLGARAVIRDDTEDFVVRARELTGGRGADRIIDIKGGEVTARNVDAAARSGHIIMIGTLAGRATDMSLGKIVAKWLTVSGSTLRPQTPAAKAEIAARMRSDLWPALGDVVLPRPKVQALPIAAAAEAHRLLESPAHFGKIVLVTAFGAGQIR